MYILTDRANGEILGKLSSEDFNILQEHLVRESSEDYDFYINQATLSYLLEQGLSQQVYDTLESHVQGRGLDLGWEPAHGTVEFVHSGTVIDDEGQPLGGIRIDLMDQDPLQTGELQEEPRILDWTYSRLDGTFAVGVDLEAPGTFLRLSGRGDLVLDAREIESVGSQGELLVQTVTGEVHSEDGEPLVGVSVQLLSWDLVSEDSEPAEASLGGSLSWGDTDEEGRFVIPVHLPENDGLVSLRLEVLAQSGQSLWEDTVNCNPSQSFEVGPLVVPEPDQNWGEEDSLEGMRPTNEMFEHPLG